MCIPKPTIDLMRTYSTSVLTEPTFANAVKLKYIDDADVNLIYCNSEVCSRNGRIKFARDVLDNLVKWGLVWFGIHWH